MPDSSGAFASLFICSWKGHDWERREAEKPVLFVPETVHKCSRCKRLWVGEWEDGFEDGDNPPGYEG